jgi:hypothetical protein
MKPVLRTLLAIDAVVVLLIGLLFVATPWLSMFEPLAGLASSPALIGQLLGVVLLGFAWLLAHAVTHGAVTAPVARITGHTMWIAALVLLVWVVAIRVPVLGGPQQLAGPIVGVLLLILGLAQARLGGAVRSRERREAVGAVSAARAEQRAQVADAKARAAGVDPYVGTPAAAFSRDATEARFTEGPGVVSEAVPVAPASATGWERRSDGIREPAFAEPVRPVSPAVAPAVHDTDIDSPKDTDFVRRRDVPPSF